MNVDHLSLNKIIARQFEPAFRMLRNLLESCPKALWSQKNIEPPIWQQFYHVLYGLDYWFSGSRESFNAPHFGDGVNSVLGEPSDGVIDQLELINYLNFVMEKALNFIDGIAEQDLASPSAIYAKWTNMDVILEQLRHLQHHIGYMNRVFLKCKIRPVEWEFYEEVLEKT